MDISSIFKKAEKTISTLKKHATVYSCYIESKEDVLLEHAQNVLNNDIKINNDAERVFYDSISIIPQYHSAGEIRARIDFFLRIARGLVFFRLLVKMVSCISVRLPGSCMMSTKAIRRLTSYF